MNVWDVFWFLFVFIPLTILWFIALLDMFGRRDLVGWQKAIWAMVIIFFPWIGVFAYLIVRPREAPMPTFMTAPPPSTHVRAANGAPQGTSAQSGGDGWGTKAS